MLLFILAILFIVLGGWFFYSMKKQEGKVPDKEEKGLDSDEKETRKKVRGLIKIVSGVILIVGIVLLFISPVTIVPAGHVGVVDVFGSVSERPLSSGMNLVIPWAKVEKMTVQTQELKETMQVPSKEGLPIGLEVSVVYHLNPDKAVDVYNTVAGADYTAVIIEPIFRSVVREITSSYEAKALYSSERSALEGLILKRLKEIVEVRGIGIESTPLRNINLPEGLTRSIEQKMQAEQENQKMEFTLQKEQKEAERKKIEAKGISDFQNIVTQGISEPLLKWKGIEATENIAKSPNAKIIVIGAGKDGLPLILGGQ